MKIDVIERNYLGFKVRVFKHQDTQTWHPFPWNFEIEDPATGAIRRYAGIPNKCETSRQALKRAWWRCRWLRDGTYENRYRSPVSP